MFRNPFTFSQTANASFSSQTADAALSLPQILHRHLNQVLPGTHHTLVSKVWYDGTNPDRTLEHAQTWTRQLRLTTESPVRLTYANVRECRAVLFQHMGPGFWFEVLTDRSDTVLRVRISLHRNVTATPEAYNAFLARAAEEDRQAKALARAPAWNAFVGPSVFEEAGEGFQ